MLRAGRNPGPLGTWNEFGGGRMAGPLGFGPGIFAVPNQVSQVVRTKLNMPPPARSPEHKRAHEFTWPLFNQVAGRAVPDRKDVQQGYLGNCALAAVLAALAHTDVGRNHILSLITTTNGPVETDLTGFASKLDTDDDSPPHPDTIVTNRFFTVRLAGKSTEVSDVLYTDNSSRNWSLVYMSSPTSCLWPCVIEKAYAVIHRSYANLDGMTNSSAPSANQIWEDVAGKKADVFAVSATTPEKNIIDVAKDAKTTPAIAASKDSIPEAENPQHVIANHGHAFLGWNAATKKILLWDPMAYKERSLSVAEFRAAFEAVLQWQ